VWVQRRNGVEGKETADARVKREVWMGERMQCLISFHRRAYLDRDQGLDDPP